ncbi:hypothetical protein P5673_003044 [Acropora cervicornis]|uniref:Uncharacterized protein n=1 Tax=Acropora cervicornis TaxID=6130 RepID=A0AAD9R2R5_ACRCE|nr:hypothetical protein P5673_003044 [Acropora cervicornis]
MSFMARGAPCATCSRDEVGPVCSGLESEARTRVQETVPQDEKLGLECPAKGVSEKVIVIRSSPLTDVNHLWASNQLANASANLSDVDSALANHELWVIDREARKIICENGGKYPVSLTEVMYLAREKSGCELHSTEHDYKSFRLHRHKFCGELIRIQQKLCQCKQMLGTSSTPPILQSDL